jgi:hypothetical protein
MTQRINILLTIEELEMVVDALQDRSHRLIDAARREFAQNSKKTLYGMVTANDNLRVQLVAQLNTEISKAKAAVHTADDLARSLNNEAATQGTGWSRSHLSVGSLLFSRGTDEIVAIGLEDGIASVYEWGPNADEMPVAEIDYDPADPTSQIAAIHTLLANLGPGTDG